MADDGKPHVIIANRIILIVQIALLVLLAVVFFLGYNDNNIDTGSFPFGIIIGSIGATVSVMRRINSGDAKIVDRLTDDKLFSILRPVLYGTLMSGVIYLMFLSGIVSGTEGDGLLSTNLFPDFTTSDKKLNLVQQFVQITPDGIQNTGKLLVWCFIAGYSERFVAGLLDQLERKTQKKDEDGDDAE